ncbi:MAG: DUF4336 domain-containing protein [Nannocystaceae bacterium]|nr:DUF4336 domain-containing protein [Nannocystaceae bacterium]
MDETGLEPLAEGLWGTEHDLFMNNVVHFRGRMTVVQLESGGLLLHSVVPIDDALAAALETLGPVEHIVAPNLLHHTHLAPAIERYPAATVWGVRGLADKRTDVRFEKTLGESTPSWAAEFTPLQVNGIPWATETVFFHPATNTLVVTDLVFNIHEVRGWITPWVLRMAGAYRRFAQSRLLRRAIKDPDAASDSVKEMLAWPIERVVMAHGRVVCDDAKAQLANALAPMMQRPAMASAS